MFPPESDRRTDGRTDIRTDGRTDISNYRVASLLKTKNDETQKSKANQINGKTIKHKY